MNKEYTGMVYVVLFKLDGIDSVRVFTDIDQAENFTNKFNGKLFTETLNREIEYSNNSKMMNISKPNRPEVREYFQKQLESIK